MAKDAALILESFKAPITMVRGKKYTFNVNTIETNIDGTRHPFYFTTDDTGGSQFPGAITYNVENAYERISSPDLDKDILRTLGALVDGFSYDSSQNRYSKTQPALGECRLVWPELPEMSIPGNGGNSELKPGNFYKITYKLEGVTNGTARVYCGTTPGTLRGSTSPEEGYSEVLMCETKSEISIKVSTDFVGKVESLSVKEIGMVKGLYVFTPSYDHPDNFYYQCGSHPDMGGVVTLLNAPGGILNDLEWFYTLGINQSNRTYPPVTKSDPAIVTKFLTMGMPAGLFKNIFNRPPVGTPLADRPFEEYYNVPQGDVTVSLSGLISDPENDILKYKWKHFSPKQNLDGKDLLTTFDDDTKLEATATLKEPQTDMIYTLHLEVSDSDNIATFPINIKVSGTVDFDQWDVGVSGSTFDLGDSNVPFDDLEGRNE